LEKDPSEGDVPDIFRFHASWIPMMKDNLAEVPTETVKEIGLESDYYDVYKNDLKVGNQYLGVPLMYDGLALFYNKDLVNAAADVELPKSWWDLETAAAKMTVRDKSTNEITIAGAAMGMTDNVDQWSDIVGLMLKQSGANILTNDTTNNQKIKDVLTFYTLFFTKDKVWNEKLPSSTELFAKGKLAFYFGPSWRVFNIEDMKVPGLNYDITTVPQLPTLEGAANSGSTSKDADLTNIQWSTYWVEGVNQKSKNQSEAWKFLTYLSTKENLEKLYTTASQIRAFGEIYPRKSMAESIGSNLKIKPFISAANDASSGYLSSRTWDDGLNDNMIKYFGDAINSMVLNGSSVDDVMVSLRSGIEQLKTRYSLK
jgi:ABC-type glycerol-3-phosphate transport system substrate-binding protein